jgi:hypothetical protein
MRWKCKLDWCVRWVIELAPCAIVVAASGSLESVCDALELHHLSIAEWKTYMRPICEFEKLAFDPKLVWSHGHILRFEVAVDGVASFRKQQAVEIRIDLDVVAISKLATHQICVRKTLARVARGEWAILTLRQCRQGSKSQLQTASAICRVDRASGLDLSCASREGLSRLSVQPTMQPWRASCGSCRRRWPRGRSLRPSGRRSMRAHDSALPTFPETFSERWGLQVVEVGTI